MAQDRYAWATHVPADYMLVFSEDPGGEHAVVTASFKNKDKLHATAEGLEGAEIAEDGKKLSAYCTLPDEAEDILARLERPARKAWIDRGEITFVAAGDSEGTSEEAAARRRNVSARVVLSLAGAVPRRYVFKKQCAKCGEFHGKINVMPQGGVLLDTRQLSCWCESIRCRYCKRGRVRQPLSEHFDPERRSGHVPWFGYLVPCGGCQAAGRGPDIWMSA